MFKGLPQHAVIRSQSRNFATSSLFAIERSVPYTLLRGQLNCSQQDSRGHSSGILSMVPFRKFFLPVDFFVR